MSFLALMQPSRAKGVAETLLEVIFITYVLLSFLWVMRYALAEMKTRRLIDGEAAPLRFNLPGPAGWLFAFGVLVLLFAQSPLYMILVVVGLSAFLAQGGRSAKIQFGLDRLSIGEVLKWSVLVCGAVVFVELPLGELVDRGMTLVHLPHPEQESVEIFRHAEKPAAILAFLVQAVLISPLIEELFFRGFLFSFLKGYTSTGLAVILSAGVFAFAHANLGSVLQLWMLGLVLGLAYEHSGSLPVAVGIHACWNFITAMSLLLEKGSL